ncbi:uncharacterized protein [Linepithema humile]|uniref:uncharacterized protein isoform X2 n=1 Tax=Linepithema humile TaxID=83485 RepID=UPI00351F186B
MAVTTLKEAIAPIRWLNCIFCMGVFEIPINRPRFLLSAFYVVLATIGYFLFLFKGMQVFEEAFSYEFIIFYFVLTVNILVASSAIILFWCKSENLNNIVKRCSIADNTLETLGIKKSYPKLFRSILTFMIGWLVAMILLNIMHVMWMYRDVGYWFTIYSDICFCLPIMINSVVDLTFTALIRCVQVKLQNTNILLNNVVVCANELCVYKIHDDYENKPITMVRTYYKNRKDKILHLIQTLRHLHQEITRIGRAINETFCLQLLLELAVHFTVVTATTYCLYASLIGHINWQIKGEKIIAMIVWGSVHIKRVKLYNLLEDLSSIMI